MGAIAQLTLKSDDALSATNVVLEPFKTDGTSEYRQSSTLTLDGAAKLALRDKNTTLNLKNQFTIQNPVFRKIWNGTALVDTGEIDYFVTMNVEVIAPRRASEAVVNSTVNMGRSALADTTQIKPFMVKGFRPL